MADEQVSIRPAEPNDAAALLNLLRQLETETTTFSTDDLAQLTVDHEQHEIAAIAKTRTNLLMVAAVGAELLGVATVQPIETDDSMGEVGVAVLKNDWSQGLGTALVEETLHWAIDFSSLNSLTLTVQTRNTRATALYQRLGFVRIPGRQVVRDSQGMEVTAFEMRFDLQQ